MSINFRGRTMLALACIVLVAGCSKRNEALCCETTAECTTVGFSSVQPCDLGVCVNYACTSVPGACDDDHDCDGTSNAAGAATPACVANTCAVCATSATCPASAPVCDDASHDCRTCTKDAECDSGACDLAAGTCVDQTNILYTSPKGTDIDPCTQAFPCSLLRATEMTDATHTYVVMSPGSYFGSAFIAKKTVTIVGSGSTYIIQKSGEHIYTQEKAVVYIRDLTITDHIQMIGGDEPAAIECNGCIPQGLYLDNVTINTQIRPILTTEVVIKNSTFYQNIGSVHLNADKTQFLDGVSVESPSVISNSLIINGLKAFGHDAQQDYDTISIVNNTIIGGIVSCDGVYTTLAMHNNIIASLTSLNISACTNAHHNNLSYPDPYLGIGELVQDPLFVDATNHDYRLQLSSPAIDAADPATSTDHDFDGVSRPQGEQPDIGAFEYVPAIH